MKITSLEFFLKIVLTIKSSDFVQKLPQLFVRQAGSAAELVVTVVFDGSTHRSV